MDEIRKLMRQITRMAQSYTARELKETGLSPGQMQALRVVTFHKDINQQSLADHLGIDKAAMARIVVALECKGYVERTQGGDRREKLVSLTGVGESVMRELVAYENEFYEHIFKEVDSGRMAVFTDVLREAHGRARKARHSGINSLTGKEEQTPCT